MLESPYSRWDAALILRVGKLFSYGNEGKINSSISKVEALVSEK